MEAVLEFVTVGRIKIAFFSGSDKGGGIFAENKKRENKKIALPVIM